MPSSWINKKGYTKSGSYVAGRFDIYARDNYECCYCGKSCKQGSFVKGMTDHADYATLDHIVSQWAIAQTCESQAEFRREIKNPRNLVVVCNGCNSSKKKTELFVWCATKGLDYAVILERIADRIQRQIKV